ncbi:MAG: hypothetical protein QW674_04000 [Candidatus Bathyarchaeia archaeon]
MRLPEQFLTDWFGVLGRELGCPQRFFTDNPKDLLNLIMECSEKLKPCFISVQPYRMRDQPCAVEKLFFDFDSPDDPARAWNDARGFAVALRRFYKVEPLIVYSGRKGFHVYVFLEKTVKFDAGQLLLGRRVYSELQKRLLMGLSFQTLDFNVVGDFKRLARVPFSVHEQTGSLCCPVDLDRLPIQPGDLSVYKTLDPSLITSLTREIEKCEKASLKNSSLAFSGSRKGIRPCIAAALHMQLTGSTGHLMRLAVAREYLHAGYSIDEIVSFFKIQSDFNFDRTRYYVQYAQRNSAAPFKCSTIRKLGYCLPNCKNKGSKNSSKTAELQST